MGLFRRSVNEKRDTRPLTAATAQMAQAQPEPKLPMLAGILVDVSGSMRTSIQNRSGRSINRLESFRDSLESVVAQGRDLCHDGVGGQIAPRIRLFAYGFG